ncbi:pyruvate kinase [Thermodesulfobacteriota bacterium]
MMLGNRNRKTKIICTIGPVTSSADRIKELILAGMDVARLNFSHGDHDSHRDIIRTIRRLCKELGKEVGILQDLRGPKIRIGRLPVPEWALQTDEIVFLSPRDSFNQKTIPVDYPYLMDDVSSGDRILLADGRVELIIEEKHSDRLKARVLVGGVIHSHKGVNLPSSPLRIPAFTEKDQADLALGLEEEVDFVALSFVRHEKDLEPLREMLLRSENPPLLIAKIEKPQAIERFEQILEVVDGVMVARGDLGVEMPLEEVPIIQKRIIQMARLSVKPVITATQMLASMVNSPRPTRAEAADVANAVLDGTDALMLSEETAIGDYPIATVRIMDRIAKAAEPHLREHPLADETLSEKPMVTESAIARSACRMAEDLHAAAIVAGTTSGSTARLVARFRPSCPVLGLTPNRRTERQLSLSWGVIPSLVAPFSESDEIFELAGQWTTKHDIAQSGDRVIVTAGVPVGKQGTTNLLKVIEIE